MGFQVSSLEFGVWCLGFEDWGLWLAICSLWFVDCDFGSRVWGLGFKVAS